ncbi:MAG: hypothetical protein R2939_07655 [Kofleriaceae bacterium]
MKQTLSTLTLGILFIAACGNKGGGGFDGVVAKMEGFKAQACACTTVECAAPVVKAYKEYIKGAEKSLGQVSKEQDAKLESLDDAIKACARKSVAPPADPPPPAGDGSAAADGSAAPAGDGSATP